MPTLEQLNDLQGTEHKGITRIHVGNQMLSYCKQTGEDLSLVDLPASDWLLAKWLIPRCNIKKIIGVELDNKFTDTVKKK